MIDAPPPPLHPSRRLAALSWSFLGEGTSRAATLLLTLFAARGLPPREFALFIALIAVALLSGLAWDFGMSGLAGQSVASRRTSVRVALRSAVRARLLTLPLFIGMFAAGTIAVRAGATPDPLVLLLFFGAAAAGSWTSIAQAVLRGEQRFRTASLTLAAGRSVGLLVAAAAFAVGRSDLAVYALSFAIAEALGAALTIAAALRGGADLPRSELLRLRNALPFTLSTLLISAYNRLDVVIVAVLAGSTQFALYAPASRLQDALYLLPFVVGAVAMPLFAREVSARRSISVTAWSAAGCGSGLLVAALIALFPEPIITFVLGASYAGSAESVRIIVWFLPLALIQSPIYAALVATQRAGVVTKLVALTFVSALVIHALVTPRFGAEGAAAAAVGRDLVATGAAVIIGRRLGLVGRAHPPRLTASGEGVAG